MNSIFLVFFISSDDIMTIICLLVEHHDYKKKKGKDNYKKKRGKIKVNEGEKKISAPKVGHLAPKIAQDVGKPLGEEPLVFYLHFIHTPFPSLKYSLRISLCTTLIHPFTYLFALSSNRWGT